MCLVENCNSKLKGGLGYCSKHYQQIIRHGKIFNNTLKDFNEVIDKGTHYELILTDTRMNETGRAKIDKEDLNKIKAIGRWSLNKHKYVVSGGTGKIMHRVVMDALEGEDVDHKRVGIKYRRDNRKSKLRKASRSQNNCNVKKRTDNTSGYKGVYLNKRINKWVASISFNSKRLFLGNFNSAKDASLAYREASKKLHGEFANK